MKTLSQILVPSLLTFVSLISSAGPTASGGMPPTEYEMSRAAIAAILSTPKVQGILLDKGAIQSIVPDPEGNGRIYVITTEQCELHARFIRTCGPKPEDAPFPKCEDSAEVLLSESVGDCK